MDVVASIVALGYHSTKMMIALYDSMHKRREGHAWMANAVSMKSPLCDWLRKCGALAQQLSSLQKFTVCESVRLTTSLERMAPIPSESESDSESSESSRSGSGSRDGDSSTMAREGAEAAEEEFHTEDESDVSDEEEDANKPGANNNNEEESDSDSDEDVGGVPLLPESVLKQATDSAQALQNIAGIPWEKLTRKQKKARRHNSRKAKKRDYDRLREQTKGSGVVEAGKVAQVKRGVAPLPPRNKVAGGRVQKRGKAGVQASGRQQMLEERKRSVGRADVANLTKTTKRKVG